MAESCPFGGAVCDDTYAGYNPQKFRRRFCRQPKRNEYEREGIYNMKEFITKDEYGSTVILKFSDTPNKKVEDNILEMLVRTYEERLDVSSKLDGSEKG